MGCFNTAPLEYRDALRLMRNLEPSRQNYCLLLLFEDFFSPWHVLLLERSQLLCYNCRCFCSYVHFKIERAQSCGCCQFKTSKEKNLCLFFIEMGLKCATFLPDECTDSAEMLTYIMTELSAHSLHPSWHIYTSASAPDQTSRTSKTSIFFHFGNLYKCL